MAIDHLQETTQITFEQQHMVKNRGKIPFLSIDYGIIFIPR
jgi:hypothetical protein